jgi:hypothetical protein
MFACHSYIPPLTKQTIESLKPRIEQLNRKIENLNHAFETENMKGILTPYEVLLVLRCLEFQLLHDNLPVHLNEFLENLKNQNLLNSGYENSDIKNIIEYETKQTLCFPSFNANLINMRLLSSNSNSITPQISFKIEEWEFLTVLMNMDKDINSEKYLQFFKQLPSKLADVKFLEKIENFLSMGNFNLLSIDNKLYSRLEVEAGNIYNGKEILSFIKKINEGIKNNQKFESYEELLKFSIYFDHFSYSREFPTWEEISQADLPKNSQLLLRKIKEISNDIALIPIIKSLGNISNVEDSIEILNDLPACVLDWTREQIELTYRTITALYALFQSHEWRLLEKKLRDGAKTPVSFARDRLNYFAESESSGIGRGEFEVPAQRPLIEKLIGFRNQIGENLLAFAERPSQLGCSHLPKFPLRSIFKKIEHLNLLHFENRLKDIKCADKLTLSEYLWIQKAFDPLKKYLSQKEQEAFDYFINSTKIKSRINICCVVAKMDTLANLEKRKIINDPILSKWKRIVLRIAMWLDSKIIKYGHISFLILDQNQYSKCGLRPDETYHHPSSGKINPHMGIFQVNGIKFGKKLNVSADKLKEFEMVFETKLLSNLKADKKVHFNHSALKLFIKIFSINPFLKPKNFKLDEKKEYVCSEFVYRNLVQAACETLEELNLPLPQNMKPFGIGYFNKTEGITPDQVMKKLIDLDLISENKHLSQLVDI